MEMIRNCMGKEDFVADLKSLDASLIEKDFAKLKNLVGDEMALFPELFDAKQEKRHLKTIEIIPSSNPESPIPDSFDNISLTEFEKEVKTYVISSINEGNDDENILKIGDYDKRHLLEETESLEFSSKNISIPELCCKLRPSKLLDPFEEKYENEMETLKSDRTFIRPNLQNLENDRMIPDIDVTKIKIEEEDEAILEEIMIMPDCDEVKTSLNELLKTNEPIEMPSLNQMNFSDLTLPAIFTSVEHFKTEDHNSQISMQDSKEKDPIIWTDLHNEDVTIESKQIETPIPFDNTEPVHSLSNATIAKELKEHIISPLNERHFISPQLKSFCEYITKEKDRFLSDTSSMILEVPQLESVKACSHLGITMTSCNVLKRDIEHELEISLPWDPIAICSNEMKYAEEELNRDVMNFASNKVPKTKLIDDDVEKIPIEMIADSAITGTLKVEDRKTGQTEHRTELKTVGMNVRQLETDAKKQFISKLEKMETKIINGEHYTSDTKALVLWSDARQRNASSNHTKQVSLNDQSRNLITPQKIGPLSNMTSPLDHFVLLRTGMSTPRETSDSNLPVALVPPRSIVKAAKVRPSVFKNEMKKKDESCMEEENAVSQKSCEEDAKEIKKEREIISVTLTDQYMSIIRRFQKDSRPLLAFLKNENVLSMEYQFFMLQPDVTRFLLRQQQMKYTRSPTNENDANIMKGIICLHALVLSFDAISNYGIRAAIGVLKSIREKYHDLINGLLEPIRKQLAKDQYKFDTLSQYHPKIERITNMIRRILVNQDIRVMILVRRYFQCCFDSLQACLCSVKNVILRKYPKEMAEESFLLELLSEANIIVAELSQGLEFCPWNRFNYIIEFEFKEESQWYLTCWNENPHLRGFFAVKCSTPSDVCAKETNDWRVNEDTTKSENSLQCFSEHILIGSTKITNNKQLLSELENRFNITIIERDYSTLYLNLKLLEHHLQPDVIIDERTCIILCNHSELNVKDGLERLEKQLLSAQLKCSKCYVIINCIESLKTWMFPRDVIEKLTELFLRTSSTRDKTEQTKYQMLYAFSIEHVAQCIVDIANHARDCSEVWTRDEWGKRFWLTVEMSMHEKFLLSFPFFTSFSAQIALTAISLEKLLSCTVSEMKLALKWIPGRTIQAFHSSINDDILNGGNNHCPTLSPNMLEVAATNGKNGASECNISGNAAVNKDNSNGSVTGDGALCYPLHLQNTIFGNTPSYNTTGRSLTVDSIGFQVPSKTATSEMTMNTIAPYKPNVENTVDALLSGDISARRMPEINADNIEFIANEINGESMTCYNNGLIDSNVVEDDVEINGKHTTNRRNINYLDKNNDNSEGMIQQSNVMYNANRYSNQGKSENSFLRSISFNRFPRGRSMEPYDKWSEPSYEQKLSFATGRATEKSRKLSVDDVTHSSRRSQAKLKHVPEISATFRDTNIREMPGRIPMRPHTDFENIPASSSVQYIRQYHDGTSDTDVLAANLLPRYQLSVTDTSKLVSLNIWNDKHETHRSVENNIRQDVYSKEPNKWKSSTNGSKKIPFKIIKGRKTVHHNSCQSPNDDIVFLPMKRSLLQNRKESSQAIVNPLSSCLTPSTSSTVRLEPSKKRRLTFTRDPGAKDGQTKLTFM